MTKKLDLVGVAEVADMLGRTRQRVHQLIRENKDFPEPVAVLTAGKIWLRPDIERWAKQHDKLPRSR